MGFNLALNGIYRLYCLSNKRIAMILSIPDHYYLNLDIIQLKIAAARYDPSCCYL